MAEYRKNRNKNKWKDGWTRLKLCMKFTKSQDRQLNQQTDR